MPKESIKVLHYLTNRIATKFFKLECLTRLHFQLVLMR